MSRRFPLILVPFVVWASAVGAQTSADPSAAESVRISGHVVDQTTGRDLPSVRLELEPQSEGRGGLRQARTGPEGRFIFEAVPRGTYDFRVEALGFSDVDRALSLNDAGTVDIRVRMAPSALELDPIVVRSTRLDWLREEGFYERRDDGMGYTLTREEIEARGSRLVSDLLFGVPGVRVISERAGRRPAAIRLRNGCVPQIVLNGAPFSNAATIPIDQVVSVGELEALEVYHGSTGPVRFSGSSCGTVMVWTRRSTSEGRPHSWERYIAAAGIVALIVFSIR